MPASSFPPSANSCREASPASTSVLAKSAQSPVACPRRKSHALREEHRTGQPRAGEIGDGGAGLPLPRQHLGAQLRFQPVAVAHRAVARRNVLCQRVERGQDQRHVVAGHIRVLADQVRICLDVIEVRVLGEHRQRGHYLCRVELVPRGAEQVDVLLQLSIGSHGVRQQPVQLLQLGLPAATGQMRKDLGPVRAGVRADIDLRGTGQDIAEVVLDAQVQRSESALGKTRQRAFISA